MFGRGKKKRAELPNFGFETLPDPVAPTAATEDIRSKQNVIRFLWTTLAVFIAASLYFSFSLESVATIAPYVADGGVFGCPVPVLEIE